jgi:hypothetical protein
MHTQRRSVCVLTRPPEEEDEEGQLQLAGGSDTLGHHLDPHVYVVPELNTHTTRLGTASYFYEGM